MATVENIGIRVSQERPGYYWQLQDAGGLRFSHSNGEPPTSLQCYKMDSCLVEDLVVHVPLSRLEYLALATFGPARPTGKDSTTKWTGDSHKYALYAYHCMYRTGIVLVENHGGGMQCYLFDGLTAFPMWRNLIDTLTNEQLWDVCAAFADTYRTSKRHEHRTMCRAFVEKRIKIVRRGGIRVEVLPETAREGKG